MHLVSALSTYRRLINPWGPGAQLLLWAAIPVLAAMFALFLLREQDRFLSIDDRGFKRLVAHVSSRAAGCQYCMAHTIEETAHSGVEDEKLAAIWEYQSSPLFTEAERVALNFAAAASVLPNAVTDQSFQDLRRHRSEEQIVEIVATIAMFGSSTVGTTRWANRPKRRRWRPETDT